MKKLTPLEEYSKLERFWAEKESIENIAHERGLSEITDDVILDEIEHQYECAGFSGRYEAYFGYIGWYTIKELKELGWYEDFAHARDEYKKLKRLYEKYWLKPSVRVVVELNTGEQGVADMPLGEYSRLKRETGEYEDVRRIVSVEPLKTTAKKQEVQQWT